MKNQELIGLLPLKTKRLIIRPTSTEDIDMILKMDKQELTQKFLGGVKNKTREERLKFLEKKENQFKEGKAKSLTVCLKDGTPIGFFGIDIDEDNNNAEISYIFDLDYCNQGYCTEAAEKIVSIGFNELKLTRMFADTIDGNISSKRVLEKMGFAHEGTRRKAAYVSTLDEFKDFLDYGIIKSDYEDEKRTRSR